MKKIFPIIVALLFILSAKAQRRDSLKGLASDTLIFAEVQQVPKFPDGDQGFRLFLAKTVKYPATAMASGIKGRVIITMVIEKDGSVTHARVVRHLSSDLDKEALRVMSLSPKWKPGIVNGKYVRTYYSVAVGFIPGN